MNDEIKTEQKLRRHDRQGCFVVGIFFCLLLTALLSYGYFSLKSILVGNGIVWTTNLYSSYLRGYNKKLIEYPTCQPVNEFAWLSISEAICREKYNSQQYSPDVWQEASYEEFLDYDYDTIRVAIRQQNSGQEGFCLIYFHGYREYVIRKIDEAVRSGRFRGSNSLESLLEENRGQLRTYHHFDRIFDVPADQVINFIETFSRGHVLPATQLNEMRLAMTKNQLDTEFSRNPTSEATKVYLTRLAILLFGVTSVGFLIWILVRAINLSLSLSIGERP